MLLGGALVDRSTWKLGVATLDKSRLPQEILNQVALILGQEEDLGLLNNISKVSNKVSAFSRKLGGRVRQRS